MGHINAMNEVGDLVALRVEMRDFLYGTALSENN